MSDQVSHNTCPTRLLVSVHILKSSDQIPFEITVYCLLSISIPHRILYKSTQGFTEEQWNTGWLSLHLMSYIGEQTTFKIPTVHLLHIPQCITLEQKFAHFCSKVVHCGIWNRCNVGFERLVLHLSTYDSYTSQHLRWPILLDYMSIFYKSLTFVILVLVINVWYFSTFHLQMLSPLLGIIVNKHDVGFPINNYILFILFFIHIFHFQMPSVMTTLLKENGHIDGLVEDCSISIANALEKLQSCTKPSI